MATLRPRVAQSREGKAQARRSQGLFASALRRSSKAGLESGGGQTTSSRAIPVTLIPVRTPAASPWRNWTSSPQRARVTSRAHPAFCPLGQARAMGIPQRPSQHCGGSRRSRATMAPWSSSGWAGDAASCPPSGCARSRTGRREARLEPAGLPAPSCMQKL